MTNIQGIKIGNVINFSVNGKLYRKVCKDITQANELFKIVLNTKENSTEENLKKLKTYLYDKVRALLITDWKEIEIDIETGNVYLAGFNTPIPSKLVDVIVEYHENGFPLESILNFWKLLMINPDKRIRTSLFDFIATHDFVLTDGGYMIVYKAVYYADKEQTNNKLTEFVSNKYLQVKNKWKCSPNKYVVYYNDNDFVITKTQTAQKNNIEVLGKLGDMYNALVILNNEEDNENQNTSVMYTDMRTKSMKIQLGKPTKMDRKDCDSDPANNCSYGLHVGATKYVEKFASQNSVVLACFVNPANVVAVPNYDNSKIRVTEYYPFAKVTYENGVIEIIDQMYFENDYSTIEVKELNKQIELIKAQEQPIETAIKAEKEERPMSELLKILKQRVLDITN